MTHEYDAVRAAMNDGSLYVDYGPGLEALEAERVAGKELTYDFNHSRPSEAARRTAILQQLLGSVGRGRLDRAAVPRVVRLARARRRRSSTRTSTSCSSTTPTSTSATAS